MVARCRMAGSATVAAASAISPQCSRMSGSRISEYIVVMAPITSASPASRTPASSPSRPMSTSRLGKASRSRSSGSRLCPPAITLASSPPPSSACTASASDEGRT